MPRAVHGVKLVVCRSPSTLSKPRPVGGVSNGLTTLTPFRAPTFGSPKRGFSIKRLTCASTSSCAVSGSRRFDLTKRGTARMERTAPGGLATPLPHHPPRVRYRKTCPAFFNAFKDALDEGHGQVRVILGHHSQVGIVFNLFGHGPLAGLCMGAQGTDHIRLASAEPDRYRSPQSISLSLSLSHLFSPLSRLSPFHSRFSPKLKLV